jgi:hypothetical protein
MGLRKDETILAITAIVCALILVMILLYAIKLNERTEDVVIPEPEPLVARYTVVTEYGTFPNVDHGSHIDGVAKLFLSDGSVVWVSGSYLMTEN